MLSFSFGVVWNIKKSVFPRIIYNIGTAINAASIQSAMIKRKELIKSSLKKLCYYCGNYADTRDHIPSKVLLDTPYPNDIESIPCCRQCNNSFSKDEEYAAVLIECIKQQSTNIKDLKRPKVQKIIKHSPYLLNSVCKSIEYDLFGHMYISKNDFRFYNVLLKLIKAHLRNENSLFLSDELIKIEITTLDKMNAEQQNRFFRPQKINIFPEIGSKALWSMLVSNNTTYNDWHVYQNNTYMYYVSTDGEMVKFFIQDFLAIEAVIISDF